MFWKLRLLPRVKLRLVQKHVLYFGIPEDVDLGSSEERTQDHKLKTECERKDVANKEKQTVA